ncbi:MAG: hypothetical protein ACYDH6_04285 [Acidimicrobiales bacterium]
MTRRRLLMLCGVLALPFTLSAAHAETVAARITAVSWWSRQPGATAQPAGGFQISYGVDGIDSVAALRVEIAATSGLHVTLTLTEASGGGSSRAAMRVCTTTGTWTMANPGAYQQAPPADCRHAVSLTHSPTTATWAADVSSLATAGKTANVMVVPVSQAVGGQVDTGFTVTVKKAAVAATGSTAPTDTAPKVGAATGPTTTVVVATTVPAAAAIVAETPTTPSITSAPASANLPAIASPVFSPQIVHHTKPWWRLALFVPVAALAGVGAVALRQARADGAR